MARTNRTRTIVAASLSVLVLAGCGAKEVPVGDTTAPTASPAPAPPTALRGNIVDVPSGDTVKIQVVAEVYKDASGKRTTREVTPRELVWRDYSYDSPDPGQCGHEQARDALVEVLGWDRTNTRHTIEVTRRGLDEAGVPKFAEDGTEIWRGPSVGTSLIDDGFAKPAPWYVDGRAKPSGEWTPEPSRVALAKKNGAGLWKTCWA